ncbi:hypothetical protein ACFE04_011332 [Oxalis oulophora]
MVFHLPISTSDHLPIVLKSKISFSSPQKAKRFRFENYWVKNEKCEKVIKECCVNNLDWIKNVPVVHSRLQEWSRNEYGSIKVAIRKAQEKLNKALCCEWQRKDVVLMKELEGNLNLLLDYEAEMVSTLNQALVDEKAYKLVNYPDYTWNEELIDVSFSEEEAKAIKAMPIGNGQVSDQWIWENARNGCYSVKSGYVIAQGMRPDLNNDPPGKNITFWSKLWNLNMYPKLKIFAWKLSSEILPTKLALSKKGMGMRNINTNDIVEWLNVIIAQPEGNKLSCLFATLWQPMLNDVTPNSLSVTEVRRKCWVPPMNNVVKINFDATFSGIGNMCYYGCIARNAIGDLLQAESGQLGWAEDAIYAEALACAKAVRLADRLNCDHIILEGDNLSLISEMKNTSRSFLSCGVLIDIMKSNLSTFHGTFTFNHIVREGNKVAHALSHLKLKM